MEIDKRELSFLSPRLADLMVSRCSVREFPANAEILREEQYVKVLPLVLSGLVKVFSKFNDRELLLYYIEPAQSCIMSFYAALKNKPSKVWASTEEDSRLLLIPVELLPEWIREFPDFNELIFNQYNLRYSELLDTIGHLLTDKMDKRLYEHLKKKSVLRNDSQLRISHSQLADELGTAREVITRMLKKLEIEGKVTQGREGIKIIDQL
jgi:CRP/FNR family transcriptional regulator